MPDIDVDIDFEALDYRCDPRIESTDDDEKIFATSSDGQHMWRLSPSPHRSGDPPDPWIVVDGDEHLLGVYGSPEEAAYSVLGPPVPSAYIKDTRIQPIDRNGEPVTWDDDPGIFELAGGADVYHVNTRREGPYWIARPDRRPVTTWALLDQALAECLGEPDRAWNAED